MQINAQTIITVAGVITALGVILGIILKWHSWYLRQNKQDDDLKSLKETHLADMRQMKEENTLICYALSACLDGLQQLGCNHTVPDAKSRLEKHLNQQAHK